MSTKIVGVPAHHSLHVVAPHPPETYGFNVLQTQEVTVHWDLGAHGATFQAGQASVSIDGEKGNAFKKTVTGKRRGCGFLGFGPCQGASKGSTKVKLSPGKYVFSVAVVADYSEANATLDYSQQHAEVIPDAPPALLSAVVGNPQASYAGGSVSWLDRLAHFVEGKNGLYVGGGLVVLSAVALISGRHHGQA